MEIKEKTNIKLRFGLSLKKILDRNKLISEEKEKSGSKDKNIVNSFGRLELASGVPKATLVQIVAGKKNAASTTWAVIIEALEMKLSEFGIIYDAITEKEVYEYKIMLDTNKKVKASQRNKRSQKKAKK